MDFKSTLQERVSIIENRQTNTLKQSIIDRQVSRLRVLLQDTSLHEGFVVNVLQTLSEAQIDNIADYAVRKGNHKGKLFVRICQNEMDKKRT